MEWYCQNWRGRYISKKKLKITYVNKLIFFILLSGVISCILLIYIDKKLNKVLCDYVNIEVYNVTSRLVNGVVTSNGFSGKYLVKDSNNNFSYNTKVINEYVDMVSNKIDEELISLESGKYQSEIFNNSVKKYKNIKNGFITEVMVSSIRGSTLFSSLGPGIPVRLVFIGGVSTDIDIKTEEYGINNVLVKLTLNIKVRERTSLPFTSNEQVINIEEPLSMDIIRGDIPDYYKTS